MLALAEYEDGLCPGCGLPLAETTADVIDPDTGKPDPMASMDQYQVTPHSRCYACTALGEAEQDGQRIQPHALRWRIERR